jgi:fluoroacetyl-CoA thioesterase
MSKPVPAGTRAEVEEKVELKHTLTAHHPELPPVYSTPDMIRLMETACFHALQPFAEGDEITVGTHISVDHRAATPVGVTVKAEAVLDAFDGRFYSMRVRAWAVDGDGRSQDIGSGTVGRAFVSVGKFLSRMQKK